jgi:guanylate kinase
MENKKGLMLVISGPAGSGKGTVNNHLLETGDFVYSVSATTRPPRPGEINGKNYHFITREEFEKRIKSEDMLEYTEYCTNLYGTPKKEAEEVLASGKNLILEIEVEGAANVKAKYPDAVLILLLPPSFEIQEQRLRNRGTETEEKILLRLARTKEELKSSDIYDYVVYNHDGRDTEAAEQIMSIVNSERCALKRNPNVAKLYFSKNK